MKASDTTSRLVCAGVLALGAVVFQGPLARAQTAQGQSQANDSRVRQLQSQPPKTNAEQEWKDAVAFMQANCPNRINFVLTQLQNRPLQLDRAKELILKQYRQINSTKDKDIHDMAVKQAQIQDQVFGALLEYRAAKSRNDQRRMLEVQKSLREAENQQVNVQIALRMLRIQHLKAEIEEFDKKRQSYVDNWTKDELKRATTGEFVDEGSSNRSGNAVIEDPPAVKK